MKNKLTSYLLNELCSCFATNVIKLYTRRVNVLYYYTVENIYFLNPTIFLILNTIFCTQRHKITFR